MDIAIKGKNMDVGDALSGHVEGQLGAAVTKYFNQAIDANVVFSKQAHQRMRADITVHPGPRGLVIQGKGENEDPYAAFDGALERITKQLRRYKRRLSNHHKGHRDEDVFAAQYYVMEPEGDDREVDADGQPAIIAEMPTDIATMSVGEAVMRMDLADAPVVMFRNSVSGGLNVVYRRTDGNVGWIDPADKD